MYMHMYMGYSGPNSCISILGNKNMLFVILAGSISPPWQSEFTYRVTFPELSRCICEPGILRVGKGIACKDELSRVKLSTQ